MVWTELRTSLRDATNEELITILTYEPRARHTNENSQLLSASSSIPHLSARNKQCEQQLDSA